MMRPVIRIDKREMGREKTNITLHPVVKSGAIELAKSQGRSLSELIERLLEDEIRESEPRVAEPAPSYDAAKPNRKKDK